VIIDEKPVFLTVNQILKYNTTQTKELLRKELEIRKGELLEKLLFSSLEKIFIENRIYRDIEECTTWDAVLEAIDHGLDPYKPDFYRTIVQEDLVRLTEIKIKRISKFDTFKADELMKRLQDELKEVNYNLKHLTDFAIAYYQNLLDKYGKGRERKTEIRAFDTIQAAVVAANNAKLYVNRVDGFVGYGLKKDEYICECSDLDDIIAIRRDGKLVVSKIQEKLFMGKDIVYVGVFRKNDERMTYNFIYLDGVSGRAMVKRFQVGGVTRDKEYELTKGTKGSKLMYLTANPNGEAEVVTVYLTQGAKARVKVFDFDFAEIEIKGRAAGGNILTRYPVRKVQFKMEGKSTLGGLNIYYDASVGRLNTDARGKQIGNFLGDDKILVCYKNGDYELTSFELTNRYVPTEVLLIQKFDVQKVIGAVYYDGSTKGYFVKRFLIETTTLNKRFNFITEHKQSYLKLVTTDAQAQVSVTFLKGKVEEQMDYDLEMLIDVKGWKALGNKLSANEVKELKLIESEQVSEQAVATVDEQEEETETAESPENQEDDLEVGSTLTLTPKKGEDEQLGLF
jgi:topoisomerase-4 subunit A